MQIRYNNLGAAAGDTLGYGNALEEEITGLGCVKIPDVGAEIGTVLR